MVHIELQAYQGKVDDCRIASWPPNLQELQKFEDPTIYDAERLAPSGGRVRPLAIRTTSGHSFSGGHKYKLCVNIDLEMMNMRLTKELSFKLAGGYHVTRIENLPSIVMKGIMPRGGSGGRDHRFFGEYAPWDQLNSSALAYLGSDTNFILVLFYVPIRRLLKYRSSLTYNGDVIVRDVVPFHEVQDVWLPGKSPELGRPAANPKKISSDKIINEVVCQCELADQSVPPQVVEGTMKGLVADQRERPDLIHEMHREVGYILAKSDGRKCRYRHGRCPGDCKARIMSKGVCSQPPLPKLYVPSSEESLVVGNSSVLVLSTSLLQSRLSIPRQRLMKWPENDKKR